MAARLSGLDGYQIDTGYVDNWRELITDSDFALCPRGRAPTTQRIYEALTAETIPIVIWWNVRPDPWSTPQNLLGLSEAPRPRRDDPQMAPLLSERWTVIAMVAPQLQLTTLHLEPNRD